MPAPHPLGVLLHLDGVVHNSDLPVQSFARHLCERLAPGQANRLIAGMRGVLEGKPELIPSDVDLDAAEDGYQAVEMLGRAMDLTDAEVSSARRESRLDLAASAWAVEPSEGLDELLELLRGRARIFVLTEPGDPAGAAVVGSTEIGPQIEKIVDQPVGVAVAGMLARIGAVTDPPRLLVVGTRWSGQLVVTDGAGCLTALVDRFGRRRGAPTFRVGGHTPVLDLVTAVRQRPAWLGDARDTAGSGGHNEC